MLGRARNEQLPPSLGMGTNALSPLATLHFILFAPNAMGSSSSKESKNTFSPRPLSSEQSRIIESVSQYPLLVALIKQASGAEPIPFKKHTTVQDISLMFDFPQVVFLRIHLNQRK